jgi:hypothetical protein
MKPVHREKMMYAGGWLVNGEYCTDPALCKGPLALIERPNGPDAPITWSACKTPQTRMNTSFFM